MRSRVQGHGVDHLARRRDGRAARQQQRRDALREPAVHVGAYTFASSYCSQPGVWCQGKANSLGCVPAMGFSGTPTVSGPDDFFVTAGDLLGGATCLLVWGRGFNGIPFQGGTLCVKGPFVRVGLQTSTGSPGTCGGTYTFHFSQAYRTAAPVGAYDTIYAQWVARDTANPDGTGWSLSNGIEFTVCP